MPTRLMIGVELEWFDHIKVAFSMYVQVMTSSLKVVPHQRMQTFQKKELMGVFGKGVCLAS